MPPSLSLLKSSTILCLLSNSGKYLFSCYWSDNENYTKNSLSFNGDNYKLKVCFTQESSRREIARQIVLVDLNSLFNKSKLTKDIFFYEVLSDKENKRKLDFDFDKLGIKLPITN